MRRAKVSVRRRRVSWRGGDLLAGFGCWPLGGRMPTRKSTRTAKHSPGPILRGFAVKGVFRYEWCYVKPRKRKVWFESRIIRLEARSERAAKAIAHGLFRDSSTSARWPAPRVASTTVEYLGVGGVLELGVELEPNELWWELVDTCPRVKERAGARKNGKVRAPTRDG